MTEPWWERHQRLKDEFAPRARAEYARTTRRIDYRCFDLAGEERLCPHLPLKWKGGTFRLTRLTCRIKRCPREETPGGE